MRALHITAPDHVALADLPRPAPGPGEVLLRVAFVGCCGSDLNTFRGKNPLVAYPCIPGHEVSGTVAELGGGVTGVKVGQEALVIPYTACGTCTSCRAGRFNCCRGNQTLGVQRAGAMCEWLVVPAGKLLTAPGLSLRELALVEPLTIGFHAVDRARVTAADTVAVWGCGMIGLGVVAGAAARGARVIAVDLDPAKLELARQAGAREVINGTDDVGAALRRLTADDGPTVCVEAVGTPATFRACVEHVAFAGRVAYIGYAKEPVPFETRWFVQKELDILGSRNATPADFAAVTRLLASGTFPSAAMISREVTLTDAPAAIRDWSADPGRITKLMVRIA